MGCIMSNNKAPLNPEDVSWNILFRSINQLLQAELKKINKQIDLQLK